MILRKIYDCFFNNIVYQMHIFYKNEKYPNLSNNGDIFNKNMIGLQQT